MASAMNASHKSRVNPCLKDNNILIRSLYFSPDSHWRCATLSTQRKLRSAIRQTAPYPQTITGSYKSVRQTGQAMPFQRNRKQWYQSIWRKRRHTESRVSTDAKYERLRLHSLSGWLFLCFDVAFHHSHIRSITLFQSAE